MKPAAAALSLEGLADEAASASPTPSPGPTAGGAASDTPASAAPAAASELDPSISRTNAVAVVHTSNLSDPSHARSSPQSPAPDSSSSEPQRRQPQPVSSECVICSRNDLNEVIVTCQGCKVKLHPSCYGVPSEHLPEDVREGKVIPRFTCVPCKDRTEELLSKGEMSAGVIAAARPSCELCGQQGGAFKTMRDGGYGHLDCAANLPYFWFEDEERLRVIYGFEYQMPWRMGLVCSICKKQVGFCVQCSYEEKGRGKKGKWKQCGVPFHVSCAKGAGKALGYKVIWEWDAPPIDEGDGEWNVAKLFNCPKHSSAPFNPDRWRQQELKRRQKEYAPGFYDRLLKRVAKAWADVEAEMAGEKKKKTEGDDEVEPKKEVKADEASAKAEKPEVEFEPKSKPKPAKRKSDEMEDKSQSKVSLRDDDGVSILERENVPPATSNEPSTAASASSVTSTKRPRIKASTTMSVAQSQSPSQSQSQSQSQTRHASSSSLAREAVPRFATRSASMYAAIKREVRPSDDEEGSSDDSSTDSSDSSEDEPLIPIQRKISQASSAESPEPAAAAAAAAAAIAAATSVTSLIDAPGSSLLTPQTNMEDQQLVQPPTHQPTTIPRPTEVATRQPLQYLSDTSPSLSPPIATAAAHPMLPDFPLQKHVTVTASSSQDKENTAMEE